MPAGSQCHTLENPAPYEAELAAREAALGPTHPAVAETASNLAILYNQVQPARTCVSAAMLSILIQLSGAKLFEKIHFTVVNQKAVEIPPPLISNRGLLTLGITKSLLQSVRAALYGLH